MKYKAILSLILTVCFVLFGCGVGNTSTDIRFYYCSANMDYGPEDMAVKPETRKETLDPLAYAQLVEKYLEGPVSSSLHSPFPEGTKLVSITVDQQAANIVLTNDFASLTGIDLTVACACLSLTVREITGCAKVQISAENTLLDNKQAITMDTNELVFMDA